MASIKVTESAHASLPVCYYVAIRRNTLSLPHPQHSWGESRSGRDKKLSLPVLGVRGEAGGDHLMQVWEALHVQQRPGACVVLHALESSAEGKVFVQWSEKIVRRLLVCCIFMFNFLLVIFLP